MWVFCYLDPSCHRAAECERCEASIPQEPPEDRSDSWWRFPAALNHFRPTRGKGPLPNLRHHVALLRLQCQVLLIDYIPTYLHDILPLK